MSVLLFHILSDQCMEGTGGRLSDGAGTGDRGGGTDVPG